MHTDTQNIITLFLLVAMYLPRHKYRAYALELHKILDNLE